MEKRLLDALNNLSESLTEVSNSLIRSSEIDKSYKSDTSNQLIGISRSISRLQKSSEFLKESQKNIAKNQDTIVNILKNNLNKKLNIESGSNSKLKVENRSETIKEVGQLSNQSIDFINFDKNLSEMNLSLKEIVQILGSRNSKSDKKSINKEKSLIEVFKEVNDSIKEINNVVVKDLKIELSKETLSEIKESLIDKKSFDRQEKKFETIKEIGKSIDNIDKSNKKSNKFDIKNQTIKEVAKSEKEIGFFGKIKEDSKSIKDGVSTILIIAAGVLAIGMALKIIGKVDFISVLSIAAALPLIAIAFSKISQMNLDSKNVKDLIIVSLGISTAIALSSMILSTVRPMDLSQSLTSILIAGTFSIIGYSMSKFISSFSGFNSTDLLKISSILPILMIGISAAIAGSSYLLGMVKPIGLFQAMTSIMISGVFVAIGYGISKLISSFKNVDISTAMKSSVILPLSLISVSAAIAGSSYLLSSVKPIGLFQALTSILIAGVFTTISYGLSNLIGSFKSINISDAIKASAMLPIVMVGISAAIVGSSYLLGLVKPVGFFQAITAILIAGTFTVISYGLSKMVNSFKNISSGDALKASILMPTILISLSGAIMASSHLLSMVKPIGLFQALTSIMIAGVFIALSYSVRPLLSGIKGVSYADVLKGTIIILALSTSITAVSHIIGSMQNLSLSQIISFISLGLSIGLVSIAFGGSISLINKLGGPSDFLKGGISILAISTAIALSSVILGMGEYTSYPSLTWALNSGLSLAMFGIGALLLGSSAMTPMFWVGLAAIVVTAGAITATSHIIGLGNYSIYPDLSWSLGVGLTLAGFGLGATLLGFQALNPLFYAGLGMIILVAGTIVGTSHILGMGKYDVSPPIDWAISTGLLISGFGLGAAALGLVSPLIALGLVSILAISGTILLVDKIFESGNYKKYPSKSWIDPTLLIVSKFGLFISKLAFALPFIALGSISAVAIAGIIFLMDKAFSNGKYEKYPSKKWSLGVFDTFKYTTDLLKYVRNNLGFADLALGSIKLWGLVKTLSLIDSSLDKGKFSRFPSKKWNDGVKSSLLSMIDLMSVPSFLSIMKDKISSFLGGGLDDIAKSIVRVDNILSTGEYQFYPSDNWISGTVNSILKFIKLGDSKSIMSSVSDLIKSGFGSSLEDIARKILSVDKILSLGNFSKFPDGNWIKSIEGMFKSIEGISNLKIPSIDLGFLDIISLISLKLSLIKIPSFNLDSNLISHIDNIISISTKISHVPINSSDKILQIEKSIDGVKKSINSITSVSFNIKEPSLSWISSILEVISSLNSISLINLDGKKIQSNFNVLGSISIPESSLPSKEWISKIKSVVSDLNIAISSIGEINFRNQNIQDLSNFIGLTKSLSNGLSEIKISNFDTTQFLSIKNVTKDIISTINSLEGISSESLNSSRIKIENLSKIITDTSISLSKSNYGNYPNKDWVDGVSSSIDKFSKLLISLDKIPSEFKIKSISISESIVGISKIISQSSFSSKDFDWVDSFTSSIVKISNVFSSLTIDSNIEDQKKKIGQLSDMISHMREKISKISNSINDNLSLDSSLSSLEKISMAFDRISKSIDGFSNSIDNIDTEKISNLGTVNHNMILLNAVGDKKFEKILERIEERSSRFTEAINNYNQDKKVDSNKNPSIVVNTKSDFKAEVPGMSELIQKVETMTSLLADITSVVGSKGALKNYIMSIQNEVSISNKK